LYPKTCVLNAIVEALKNQTNAKAATNIKLLELKVFATLAMKAMVEKEEKSKGNKIPALRCGFFIL
jgi:hypothetical protein